VLWSSRACSNPPAYAPESVSAMQFIMHTLHPPTYPRKRPQQVARFAAAYRTDILGGIKRAQSLATRIDHPLNPTPSTKLAPTVNSHPSPAVINCSCACLPHSARGTRRCSERGSHWRHGREKKHTLIADATDEQLALRLGHRHTSWAASALPTTNFRTRIRTSVA
jgi:hypothetical protein